MRRVHLLDLSQDPAREPRRLRPGDGADLPRGRIQQCLRHRGPPETGKVYWSDRQFSPYLSRSNFDGSNIEHLLTSPGTGVGDIALDLEAGILFWIESEGSIPGDSRIRRSNLDGSNPQSLVSYSSSVARPRGLSLDPTCQRIYWALSDFCPDGTGKVLRTDYGASVVHELFTGLGLTVGVAVDAPPGACPTASLD